MRDDKREARKREIETAAFDVMLEKGFAAASMLSIAKRAGASNETLYRWYGDKAGLVEALVARNAQSVADALTRAVEAGRPPREVLAAIGPILLGMLLSDRALLLNRAAAADADGAGALGKALASAGRATLRPMLVGALEPCLGAATDAAVETYLSLLIGDWQLRCVTGAMAPPSRDEITSRADRALEQTIALYPSLS